jgi:hypothetical protein
VAVYVNSKNVSICKIFLLVNTTSDQVTSCGGKYFSGQARMEVLIARYGFAIGFGEGVVDEYSRFHSEAAMNARGFHHTDDARGRRQLRGN